MGDACTIVKLSEVIRDRYTEQFEKSIHVNQIRKITKDSSSKYGAVRYYGLF